MTTTSTRPVSVKARRPRWDESKHPRDRMGRFIETGAEVRIWGGATGRVVANLGGGRIEVEQSGGKHVIVHRNYLTVTQRPDGSTPTTDPQDNPEEIQRVRRPQAVDAEELDTSGAAAVLGDHDDEVAELGRLAEDDREAYDDQAPALDDVVDAYQRYRAALGNGVDDDEADERAALLAALDTLDEQIDAHGDFEQDDKDRVKEITASIRDDASQEPDQALPGLGDAGGRAARTLVDGPQAGDSREVNGTRVTVGDTATAPSGRTGEVVGFTDRGGVIIRDSDGNDWPYKPETALTVTPAERPAPEGDEESDEETTAPTPPPEDETAGERINDSLSVAPGDYVTDRDGDTYVVDRIEGDQVRMKGPDGTTGLILPRGSQNSAARTLRAATDEERAAYDATAQAGRDRRAEPATPPGDPGPRPAPREVTHPRTGDLSYARPVGDLRVGDRVHTSGDSMRQVRLTAGGLIDDGSPRGGVTVAPGGTVRTIEAIDGDTITFDDGRTASINDHRVMMRSERVGPLVRIEPDASDQSAPETPQTETPGDAPSTPEGVDQTPNGQYRVGQTVEVERPDFATPGMPRVWQRGTVEAITPNGSGLHDLRLRMEEDGRPHVETVGPRGGNNRIRPVEEAAATPVDTARQRLAAYADSLEQQDRTPGESPARATTIAGIRSILAEDPDSLRASPNGRVLATRRNEAGWTLMSALNATSVTPPGTYIPDDQVDAVLAGFDRVLPFDTLADFNAAMRNENRRAEMQGQARDLLARAASGEAPEETPETPAGPDTETPEERIARANREALEGAGLDPERFRVTGAGLYASTASRVRPGDRIYTEGSGTEASPVALPRVRGGVLSRYQKVPRVVDRVERDGRNYTIHFTDGTSTGPEGGDRNGARYAGNTAVYGVGDRAAGGNTPGTPTTPDTPPEDPGTPTPDTPDARVEVPPVSAAGAATFIARQVGTPDLAPAIAAALSPHTRRVGGMYPADGWRALEQPGNERALRMVMAARAGVRRNPATGRIAWFSEPAQTALQRFVDGDPTLPSNSIGQRVRISVLDMDAPLRYGQPAAHRPVEGVVQRVAHMAPGGVYVVVLGDDGETHGETFASDGVVEVLDNAGTPDQPAQPDQPATPPVQPDTPQIDPTITRDDVANEFATALRAMRNTPDEPSLRLALTYFQGGLHNNAARVLSNQDRSEPAIRDLIDTYQRFGVTIPEQTEASRGDVQAAFDSIRQIIDGRGITRDRNIRPALDDPLAGLTPDYQLLVTRDPANARADGTGAWRIRTSYDGTLLPGDFVNREQAMAAARALSERAQGFPFASEDSIRAVQTWRTESGSNLATVYAGVRSDFPNDGYTQRAEDWNDAWWRAATGSTTPDTPVTPDPPAPTPGEGGVLGDNVRGGGMFAGDYTDPNHPDTIRAVGERMAEVFSFSHEQSGWSLDLDASAAGHRGPGRTSITGSITDANGRRVGTVQRSIFINDNDEVEVHHDLLTIQPQYQGQGFADAYYKHLYDQYEANGVDVVTIQANIDVGGYAWAQRGFDWDERAGEPSYYFQSRALTNLDNLRPGDFTEEQWARIREFRRMIADNPGQFTPVEVANSLSDITWTKTLSSGAQVRMWPGKAAMLGTNWHGKFYVRERAAGDQPERPEDAIPDVPTTPVRGMSDDDLIEEASTNSDLLAALTNVRRLPTDHPAVAGFIQRQADVSSERARRITVAEQALIPDGERVSWRDLRVGDTAVVPFITHRSPDLVTIDAIDDNEVVVRHEDGTTNRYMMIGGLATSRWLRGATPQRLVRVTDLTPGDDVVMDDGTRGTVRGAPEATNRGTVEVDVEINGEVTTVETSADTVWARGDDPQAITVAPESMTDEELRAELQSLADTRAAGLPDTDPRVQRRQALSAEVRRRGDAVRNARRHPAERHRRNAEGTARPRLYTYQRKNLVALDLDADPADRPADAPEVPELVRAAAAQVRARQALTAEQSAALADYLRNAADEPGLRVVQARSMRRLAASFDASAAVASGRRPDAAAPVNTDVTRTRPAGLTSGDTAVIRNVDGTLAQVKVLDAAPMMRGTLTRLRLEHPDGTVEERIVDRDTDTWLMPDLPGPQPVDPPDERAGRELVLGANLNPGDRIAFQRNGYMVDSEVLRVTRGHVYTEDGDSFPVGEDTLVLRVRRGDASVGQTRMVTFEDDDNMTSLGPDAVQVGDFISHDLTGVTGTVMTIDDAEVEGGGSGKYLGVLDTRGNLTTIAIFDGQTVERYASADRNTVANLPAIIAESRRRRQRAEVREAVQAVQEYASTTAQNLRGDLLNGASTDAVMVTLLRSRNRPPISTTNRLSMALDNASTVGFDDPEARDRSYRAAQDVSGAVWRDIADRLTESLEGPGLPGESDREKYERVLNQWIENPPMRDNDRLADGLIGTLTQAQGGEAITRPATPVTGATLTERVKAYRERIGTFGHTEQRVPTFRNLDIDALDRGEVPEVEYEVKRTRPRAADGGPDQIAMDHLDLVRAAGADLEADLDRRINAALAGAVRDAGGTWEDGDTWETMWARQTALTTAALERRQAMYARYMAERKAHIDALARIEGYESFDALERAGRWAGDSAVRATWLRVRDDETPELTALNEARQEAQSAHNDAGEVEKRIRRLRAQVQREQALALMREVRDMGGERLDYQQADATRGRGARQVGAGRALGERDRLVRAMRSAEDALPTDWLQAIRKHVKNQYRRDRIGIGPLARGHADYRGNIRLSNHGSQYEGDEGFNDVAVHELSHFAQRAVTGLMAAEEAFLWSRTSTGDVGERTRERLLNMRGRGGDSSQYGYIDDFPQPYTGVDYSQSRGRQGTEAWEVITTGMESLMGGSNYLDPDFRRFILGVLATV